MRGLKALRNHLTYANVLATLALFFSLAGGSYAVIITGGDVRKHTLTGRHFKSNSIGGRAIKERSLRAVPRARNAARLEGRPGLAYRVRCPEGTKPVGSRCIETVARPPLPYGSAVVACEGTDNSLHPGRQLPTHNELIVALGDYDIQLAPGGELTSHVWPSDPPDETLIALYITDDPNDKDGVALTPNTSAGAKAFRCVADPVN